MPIAIGRVFPDTKDTKSFGQELIIPSQEISFVFLWLRFVPFVS